MKQYNGEKYIVSFTTFDKRFDNAAKMCFALLSKQIYKNFHIVCTLYKDDYKKLAGNLKLLIDTDLIEVIIAEKNLKPHLKYFYVMKKYYNKPIITVDDDIIYSNDLIKLLVEKYESLKYKSIISVVAPIIKLSNDSVLDEKYWCKPACRLKSNDISYLAMAEGFGGILYPPVCFNNLDNEIKNIKNCLCHDDLFLKVLELKNKIPVTQISKDSNSLKRIALKPVDTEYCLSTRNLGMQYRNDMVRKWSSQIVKYIKVIKNERHNFINR